jgi:hypothetical protein
MNNTAEFFTKLDSAQRSGRLAEGPTYSVMPAQYFGPFARIIEWPEFSVTVSGLDSRGREQREDRVAIGVSWNSDDHHLQGGHQWVIPAEEPHFELFLIALKLVSGFDEYESKQWYPISKDWWLTNFRIIMEALVFDLDLMMCP